MTATTELELSLYIKRGPRREITDSEKLAAALRGWFSAATLAGATPLKMDRLTPEPRVRAVFMSRVGLGAPEEIVVPISHWQGEHEFEVLVASPYRAAVTAEGLGPSRFLQTVLVPIARATGAVVGYVGDEAIDSEETLLAVRQFRFPWGAAGAYMGAAFAAGVDREALNRRVKIADEGFRAELREAGLAESSTDEEICSHNATAEQEGLAFLQARRLWESDPSRTPKPSPPSAKVYGHRGFFEKYEDGSALVLW